MSSRLRQDAEDLFAKFESLWRASPPADLREFVAEIDDLDTVIELASIDLEYRWRTPRGQLVDDLSGQPRVDDYLGVLQGVDPHVQLNPAWIAEEYRVRSIWGDRPSHSHFLKRFPQFAEQLNTRLEQVDRELANEATPATDIRSDGFDPRAPLRYDDFELQKYLGGGAMGKVYRARQRSLNRDVAIKALQKSRQMDHVAIDLFLREGKILAALNHPGIVKVYGLGRFPGGGYFQALELIDGPNLRDFAESRNLSHAEVAQIVAEVAEAIAFAHGRDVLHCDLKPSNVLVRSDGRAVVTDFGMAFLKDFSAGKQLIGGTPKYLAPEIRDGKRPTVAVDIYGLGILLSELLDPAGLPDWLERIRVQCLRAAEQRPASATEVARTLRAGLGT